MTALWGELGEIPLILKLFRLSTSMKPTLTRDSSTVQHFRLEIPATIGRGGQGLVS
jgi:hypothetical protein